MRSGWIECDRTGQPLEGAQLQADPRRRDDGATFALRPGDQVPAAEAARLATAGQLASRVERTKSALAGLPTIRARDSRKAEREAVPFDDRLAATRAALKG